MSQPQKKKYELGRRLRSLDDWESRLYGEPNDLGKSPFLFFDFKYSMVCPDGVERYRDLYLGVNKQDQRKEGRFNLAMTQVNFLALISALRAVAAKEEDTMMPTFQHMDFTFFGGQRSDQRQVKGTIAVFRQEGRIFIGITDGKEERARFEVTPPNSYVLVSRDNNQQETQRKTASVYAEAYANLWESQVSHLFATAYMNDDEYQMAKDRAKKANQERFRNNGGGGQQRPQYNNQSNNAPAPAAGDANGYDNDIPW